MSEDIPSSTADIEPFNIIKIYEPSSNATWPNQYIALVGGRSKKINVFSTSTLGTNNAVFTNCNPSSDSTIVDKKIYLRARVNMKFTGTTTASTLLLKGRDGLRYMPLNSIISVARCTINNHTVVCNVYDTLHARSNYFRPDVDQLSRSTSASAIKDNCQSYSDVFGTINSPLSGFGDSGLNSGNGRGCITELEIVSNDSTGAEINFIITEQIIMAPFYQDDNNAGGPLWNINTITFDFQFVSNLNRMWCHDDGGGSIITQMATDIKTLDLLMITIDPPISLTLPPVCTTTYNNFDVVPKRVGVLQPNEERIVFSDSLQWNNVPQSLLVFACSDNNQLLSWNTDGTFTPDTITSPNSYCQINSISIDYMEVNSMLSNITREQLYQVCVNNGYNRDYSQFNGLVNGTFNIGDVKALNGSVVRLIFGKDIANDKIIPGLNERSNFQIQVKVKNIHQTKPLNITLYIVSIQEGTLQLIPRESKPDIAPIKNINDAHDAPVANIPYSQYREMMGGGFFDTLKNIGSMATGILSSMPNPALKTIGTVGNSLLNMIPSQKASGRHRGGQLVDTSGGLLAAGGRRISTAELRRIKQFKY